MDPLMCFLFSKIQLRIPYCMYLLCLLSFLQTPRSIHIFKDLIIIEEYWSVIWHNISQFVCQIIFL